jgi:inositol monophosphatase 3
MKGMDKILKDIGSLSYEAKRFILVLLGLIAIVALLWGRETMHWEMDEEPRPAPKIRMREVMSAMLDVMQRGGQEAVRLRKEGKIHSQNKGYLADGKPDITTEGDLASHKIMFHGLRRAFPNIAVISQERDDYLDMYEPMPNLNNIEEFHTIGEEVREDRLTIWIDPLDATDEYIAGNYQYVTIMAGLAVDGKCFGGIIHKPFTNETIWSFGDRKNHDMSMLMLHDELRHESPDHMAFLVSKKHAGKIKEQVAKYVKPPPTVTAASGAGYKFWEIVRGDYDVYVHSEQIRKWNLCAGQALLRTANGRLTDLKGDEIDFKSEFEYNVDDGILASKYEHHDLVRALKKIIV